jgi:hypothetical protein
VREDTEPRRFPRRPSPAMAVALIALFVALSGSAIAGVELGRNSVGMAQIRAGAVGTRQPRNNAVTGAKVADGSLTSADISGDVAGAAVAHSLVCPAGTLARAGLCVEDVLRAPAGYFAAVAECGQVGRRLPSVGELLAFRASGGRLSNPELSDQIGNSPPPPQPALQTVVYADGTTITSEASTTQRRYRCVTLPVG